MLSVVLVVSAVAASGPLTPATDASATTAAPEPPVEATSPTTTTTTTTSSPPPTTTTKQQPRILVLGLRSNGVDAALTQTLSDVVAAAVVREPGYDVASSADLENVLSTEAARQTMSCDSKLEACVAELAGALDADLVVSGSAGQLGAQVVVSIALYDARRQVSVAREQAAADDVTRLGPAVDRAVARLFGHAVEEPAAAVSLPLVVGGGAGAAVGAGVAAWGLLVQLDRNSSGDEKVAGTAALPAGLVVAGLGAAVVATAFVLPLASAP